MGVWAMNAKQLAEAADDVSENGMLKLAGRLMMLIAGPAAIWLGVTLWTMYGEQTKLTVKLDNLTTQIGELLRTQYRDSDALRDLKQRDQKDIEQDRRLGGVEVRMDRLERDLSGRKSPL